MKFFKGKDKQEVKPTSEHRLDRDQIQFLGLVLHLEATQAKDRKSKARFKNTYRSILAQSSDQIAVGYPTNKPDRNTAKITLDETERGAVGEALKFIVELDQESEPGTRLQIRLGNLAPSGTIAEMKSRSVEVASNVGETARNMQELLGFVDPQQQAGR